jgi:hypothetical protein
MAINGHGQRANISFRYQYTTESLVGCKAPRRGSDAGLPLSPDSDGRYKTQQALRSSFIADTSVSTHLDLKMEIPGSGRADHSTGPSGRACGNCSRAKTKCIVGQDFDKKCQRYKSPTKFAHNVLNDCVQMLSSPKRVCIPGPDCPEAPVRQENVRFSEFRCHTPLESLSG